MFFTIINTVQFISVSRCPGFSIAFWTDRIYLHDVHIFGSYDNVTDWYSTLTLKYATLTDLGKNIIIENDLAR